MHPVHREACGREEGYFSAQLDRGRTAEGPETGRSTPHPPNGQRGREVRKCSGRSGARLQGGSFENVEIFEGSANDFKIKQKIRSKRGRYGKARESVVGGR